MNKSELVKNIIPAIVPKEGNEELLSHTPHRDIAGITDLVLIPMLRMEDGRIGSVSKDLVGLLSMTQKEILDAAVRNQNESHFQLKGLHEMLGLDNAYGAPKILVLTNEYNIMGAAEIVNRKAMEAAADKLGEDMYILPSSKHEVLLVPSSMGTLDEMKAMVRSVNCDVVSEEDKLSDNVYHFSFLSHRLSTAGAEELSMTSAEQQHTQARSIR